ncbi:MAG: DUF4167 domain-containing protein [Alphaproteobacteria bacterium]
MRQAQHGRKLRGRGRKPNNPLSRTFDSVGPDTKVRGTASHIADRYVTLARDAQLTGDRVIAENYLQHAEHYIRIVAAAQEQALAAQQAMQAAPHQTGQPHNGQRSDSRQFNDEAAPANDQPREDDQANGAGETVARGSENSGRRGRRRERPASAGHGPADHAPQPPVADGVLQGLPPSAIQPEVGTPPEVGTLPEVAPPLEKATVAAEKAPVVAKVAAQPEPVEPQTTGSDEAQSAPAKPAPKRRRRTKATTESTTENTTENTGDPVV